MTENRRFFLKSWLGAAIAFVFGHRAIPSDPEPEPLCQSNEILLDYLRSCVSLLPDSNGIYQFVVSGGGVMGQPGVLAYRIDEIRMGVSRIAFGARSVKILVQRAQVFGKRLPPRSDTKAGILAAFHEADEIGIFAIADKEYDYVDASMQPVGGFAIRCSRSCTPAADIKSDRIRPLVPDDVWDFVTDSVDLRREHTNAMRRADGQPNIYIIEINYKMPFFGAANINVVVVQVAFDRAVVQQVGYRLPSQERMTECLRSAAIQSDVLSINDMGEIVQGHDAFEFVPAHEQPGGELGVRVAKLKNVPF